MKSIIEVEELFFGYDDQYVLENVNLTIESGDYVGIVGPNGASKTTLIKLILGLLTPDQGSVKLFGDTISSFDKWGKIGYVSQKANSFKSGFPGTVEEVVSANLYPKVGLFKRVRKEHKARVDAVLDQVGMLAFKKRLIGNLSGGQQQRVFIARALVSDPEIIFLDEPTVGIDMKSQEKFYALLDQLNKELNITIVLISHDIGVITEKVKRVICMGNKKIYCHNENCKLTIEEFLSEVYTDNMEVLLHHHK